MPYGLLVILTTYHVDGLTGGVKYPSIVYISQHLMSDDNCLTKNSLHFSPAMRYPRRATSTPSKQDEMGRGVCAKPKQLPICSVKLLTSICASQHPIQWAKQRPTPCGKYNSTCCVKVHEEFRSAPNVLRRRGLQCPAGF